MHQSVLFFSFFLLSRGPDLHFPRLDIVAFSRMFKILKIPVARLSSVSSANPFLIESLEFRLRIGLPSSVSLPLFLVATPNMFSSSSVLPEPSSPATPSISPLRAEKETSRSFEYMAERSFTSSSTSPISFVFGG